MPLPKDKKKFALWLYPQTLEEISEAYAADNCRSKSEFIEKAVKFYLAHLDGLSTGGGAFAGRLLWL